MHTGKYSKRRGQYKFDCDLMEKSGNSFLPLTKQGYIVATSSIDSLIQWEKIPLLDSCKDCQNIEGMTT